MKCNQCEKAFNARNRIPKLLPNCGHSVCKECLSKLLSTTLNTFRCPFDNIPYPRDQTYNDNLYVISMLNPEPEPEMDSFRPTVCTKHSRTLDIFCNKCKEEICADCVLFGEHKSHDYDQLNLVRSRNEAKLKKYLHQFISLKEKIDQKNIVKHLNEVKESKSTLINKSFDELINQVESARREAFKYLANIFDSYEASIDNVIFRTEELIAGVRRAQEENDHTFALKKEQSLNKEIHQIEKFTSNDIFKGKESMDKKVNIHFDSRIRDNLGKFCTVSKRSGAMESAFKESSHKKIKSEDDLLQQSFTELIKNADSLLNADFSEMDKVKTTPNYGQSKSLLDRNSQSPLSYFSHCSAFKGNLKGEEKSMLSKNNPSTHSLLSNNSINPIYTTKKPRTPLNFSPNLSNVSNVTKNSTSPSPFKSSIPNQRLSEIMVVDKENCQRLANTYDADQTLGKLKKALERAEKAGLPVLDLSKCDIDDKVMEDLSRNIRNLSKLKTINLDGNSLTELGLKHLLKNIKENVVEYLFLNQNKLKDSALDYLISFRKYNTKLKAVYMSNNPINQTSHKVKAKTNMLDDNNIVVVI